MLYAAMSPPPPASAHRWTDGSYYIPILLLLLLPRRLIHPADHRCCAVSSAHHWIDGAYSRRAVSSSRHRSVECYYLCRVQRCVSTADRRTTPFPSSMPAPTEVLVITDDETTQRRRPHPTSAHTPPGQRSYCKSSGTRSECHSWCRASLQEVLETIDSAPVKRENSKTSSTACRRLLFLTWDS